MSDKKKNQQYNYWKFKDAYDSTKLRRVAVEKLGTSRQSFLSWEQKHRDMQDIIMTEIQTVLATIPEHNISTDDIRNILGWK